MEGQQDIHMGTSNNGNNCSRLRLLPSPPTLALQPTSQDYAAHKTMETSGHPPVPCPPATLPLPLSPWVSCHLSMKECQALSSLTGTSCSSGSLDASKGWLAMCGQPERQPSPLTEFQVSTPCESPASFYHIEDL